jgi:mannose-6-phosphate isomerase-like protein (cupin superfamily)
VKSANCDLRVALKKGAGMKGILASLVFLFACSCAVSTIAAAQAASATKPRAATYIGAEEIKANLNLAAGASVNVQPNIRVVNAGGYNVAIGSLHRPSTPPGVAAVHFKVTEVYRVLDGSGTLITGGTLINGKTRAADSKEVKFEDGPGASGTGIKDGVSRQVKTGDMIVIPAGVPHWFSKIDGSITYVVVRIDPNRTLPLK